MVRVGQRLGKYRIKRRIARGGFGDVFEAFDTIEGVTVAIKVPLQALSREHLDDFRREVRITAKLDHPNILPLKNADFIDGVFVIVQPLGQGNLDQRMTTRMNLVTKLGYIDQMLAGLSYAHEQGIIHCDIKPDNLILFSDGRLRLADFGIAKFARKTIQASASGSIGYMAPEQAMGRPSARSDVFAAGLVIHQLLTSKLPTWPFAWPPIGWERLKRQHPDLRDFVRRALEFEARKRFADAALMYRAYRRLQPKAIKYAADKRRRPDRRSRSRSRR
jgi:eukaryotic-like serine/threonine-protein kinase